MKTKTRWTPLILALAAVAAPPGVCAKDSQPARPKNNVQRLAPLISFVKSGDISVWIEYHATCVPSGSQIIPFDLPIHDDTKQGQADPVSAVRDLVREDPGISVSQIRPGLIGVKSDDVWSRVFQAKLVDLKLDKSDRYNPQMAIWAGMSASEASQKVLGAERPQMFIDVLGEWPAKGRPHLKASAKYATLGDLLDDVTRTFGGILVYRECQRADGTHLFDIYFYEKDAEYDYRDWPLDHATSP